MEIPESRESSAHCGFDSFYGGDKGQIGLEMAASFSPVEMMEARVGIEPTHKSLAV
jgi:hypothetical protein